MSAAASGDWCRRWRKRGFRHLGIGERDEQCGLPLKCACRVSRTARYTSRSPWSVGPVESRPIACSTSLRTTAVRGRA